MSGSVDRQRRARAIFESVRELPPAARSAELAKACADDSELRREVLGLFDAEERMGSFLEHGVARLVTAGSRSGDRIGRYEITGLLASGGMGEVYQARDATLGRDVALKLLPDVFLADADRVARFRREAEILASLNHPHIATIYGLEDVDGVGALALELIPGPTLADRLAAGPLPLEQSLHVARQLVDALDAAHQSGIVHRDLKPANIKLRADGIVKVLDFGLAKVIELPLAPSDQTRSGPAGATRVGAVLGTAAYMSPEQAEGQRVDKRTDIWAFGCVLFEMLTGRRPFSAPPVAGRSVDSRDGPNWDAVTPAAPPALRRLLRRCLEPDRTRRLADIADARFDLAEAATVDDGAAGTPRATRRGRVAASSLVAASVAAAVWFAVSPPFHRPQGDTRVVRSSILLPGPIATAGGLALSPDGRSLAFVALAADGRQQLWVRPVDSSVAHPVAGTVNARTPFWSPDGNWIAFVQDRQLRKVPVGGGEPVTLCDGAFTGGAWSQHDVIVFTGTGFNLAAVSASAGTSSPVTRIDPPAEETLHLWPAFLPDGKHLLYVRRSIGNDQLYLRALDGTADAPLPVNATMVQVANGFIWFVRDRTLMAQALDAERRTLTGSPIAVAEQLRFAEQGPGGADTSVFSVSPAGILVFQADPSPGFELVWYDRRGRPLGTLGAAADYADIAVSPEGTRVLVSNRRASTTARDLWVFEVARGVGSRITFDDVRVRRGAIWSRDGKYIVYTAERNGRLEILRRRADGVGGDAVLLEDEFDKEVASVTPDGRHLLYNVRRSDGPPAAWVLPLEGGDGKPFPFSQPRAFFPQISPDGRWVAYMSFESGRAEIYVAPFPGPGQQTRISPAGGFDPVWRADGRELVYVAGSSIISAEVALGPGGIHVGAIKPLFRHTKASDRKAHDLSPDGRILAVTRNADTGAAPLTLVVNWPALVKR